MKWLRGHVTSWFCRTTDAFLYEPMSICYCLTKSIPINEITPEHNPCSVLLEELHRLYRETWDQNSWKSLEGHHSLQFAHIGLAWSLRVSHDLNHPMQRICFCSTKLRLEIKIYCKNILKENLRLLIHRTF